MSITVLPAQRNYWNRSRRYRNRWLSATCSSWCIETSSLQVNKRLPETWWFRYAPPRACGATQPPKIVKYQERIYMPALRIPTPLRAYTNGQSEVNVNGSKISDALTDLT